MPVASCSERSNARGWQWKRLQACRQARLNLGSCPLSESYAASSVKPSRCAPLCVGPGLHIRQWLRWVPGCFVSVLQNSSVMLSITVYLKTVLGRSPRAPKQTPSAADHQPKIATQHSQPSPAPFATTAPAHPVSDESSVQFLCSFALPGTQANAFTHAPLTSSRWP